MKTMCTAYLVVLLLTLHLSSQIIRAQSATTDPMNMNTTTTGTNDSSAAAATILMRTTVSPNSGCGITGALTVLLPLAVASSLLHGCS